MITSAQNSKLKLVRALQGRSKERHAAGAFLAEGVRLVEDAARADWEFRFVLYAETLSERGKAQVEGLKSKGVDVEEISVSLMKSISDTETPQGILAVLNNHQSPITQLPLIDFVLIPDQIRDPGNLGTLLRSAAAAGVQAALIPPETTDAFAPKVLRSGMGAHFHLPIHSLTWAEIKQATGGLQVLLADMDGQSCWDLNLRQPLALIVGGEADGASQAARALARQKIKIPMHGEIESLNAGAAGSVLMFEALRQRVMPKTE